jgi:putative flippase GtrA
MASAPSRPVAALLRLLPAPIRRKFEGEAGSRFLRFVLVAAAAVIATQVSLDLFLGPAHMSAGISGGLAAMVGAAVSYVLSRWAWERKGRPHLLKETLPFWLVSIAVWIVLAWAAKLGVNLAGGTHVHHTLKWHLIVNGTVLGFNVLTFLARFFIFHYVLFADRGASGAEPPRPVSLPEALAEVVEEEEDGNSAATRAPRSPASG